MPAIRSLAGNIKNLLVCKHNIRWKEAVDIENTKETYLTEFLCASASASNNFTLIVVGLYGHNLAIKRNVIQAIIEIHDDCIWLHKTEYWYKSYNIFKFLINGHFDQRYKGKKV